MMRIFVKSHFQFYINYYNTISSVLFWSNSILYYVYRDFGVLIKIKSLLKISFAGIILYVASFFFSQGEFIFLLWSTILFALYLIILYSLDEITKDDILYLKQIVSKKKKRAEIQSELSGNEPSA